MKNKRGFLQVSFPWLFAIIVGAVIIFLTIYAVTKFITTEETIGSAKTSKEIGILLNPLETGFQESETSSITFPVDTRLYNNCNQEGSFGRQLIRISQKSFNKWVDTDIDVGFSNKYLFSNSPTEGRTIFLFSKPFEFPFKVSDVIYITSSLDEYCFINSPNDIEDEIKALKQPNLFVEDCSEKGMINVCFSSTNSQCNINVNYGSKFVEKSSGKMYFETDSLMYAAIFSEKDLYECQVKRLMLRVSSLASLYRDKANLISRVDCQSNLETNLLSLINSASSLSTSEDLALMGLSAEDAETKNRQNSLCKLW